jgi:hypothetical protein
MKKSAIAAILLGAALCVTANAARMPDISVLPAEFRGVVLYPDGETPAEGLPVRVWDAQSEKVIYKTQTDANGVFVIPELPEGERYFTVGSVRVDMRLLTARAGVVPQAHGLVIVVPNRLPILPILVPTIPAAAAAAIVPQPLIMSP